MLASLSLIDQEKKRLANVAASASCSLRKKKKRRERRGEKGNTPRALLEGRSSIPESGRVPTVEDWVPKFPRGFNPPIAWKLD